MQVEALRPRLSRAGRRLNGRPPGSPPDGRAARTGPRAGRAQPPPTARSTPRRRRHDPERRARPGRGRPRAAAPNADPQVHLEAGDEQQQQCPQQGQRAQGVLGGTGEQLVLETGCEGAKHGRAEQHPGEQLPEHLRLARPARQLAGDPGGQDDDGQAGEQEQGLVFLEHPADPPRGRRPAPVRTDHRAPEPTARTD